MRSSGGSGRTNSRKWYKNGSIWITVVIISLVLIIIIPTIILLVKGKSEKNSATHIHYTRLNTNIHSDGYELFRLTILNARKPEQQYKLLGDFLRRSLFNNSKYEQHLPSCPIMFVMSSTDHPEDWRAMILGTFKFQTKPYPYICFLSVMPGDRRHKLGSLLLNQFINEVSKNRKPPVTHVQLHANWENCRAQTLYRRCGFRCNEFTLNGYSKPFEPEYKFGHMIRMELNLANIRNMTSVCRDTDAVPISPQDENNYKKLCEKNMPIGLNRTC